MLRQVIGGEVEQAALEYLDLSRLVTLARRAATGTDTPSRALDCLMIAGVLIHVANEHLVAVRDRRNHERIPEGIAFPLDSAAHFGTPYTLT